MKCSFDGYEEKDQDQGILVFSITCCDVILVLGFICRFAPEIPTISGLWIEMVEMYYRG